MEGQDMTGYSELVKALRLCQFGECGCGKCNYKELKGDWCTEDNHPEFFDCDDKLKLDAAAAIEELQTDIKRLKEVINELREAQTYIDHYGDRWLTSAKDVPTAAYEHGYADGRDEAEAQLPKQGEWQKAKPKGVVTYSDGYAECSHCHETIWLGWGMNFCPHCGTQNKIIDPDDYDGAKMEAQDA